MILSRIYLHLGGIALVPGFLLSSVTGCASFRQIEIPPLPENLPASHELTAVPFFPQEEYQCGPAALAMAISWSGLPARPEDLVEEVYTPSRKGSLQVAIIATARRHGRLAYEISDLESLFPEIAAGYPVIMFLIGAPVHSVLAAIIETETVMDSAREQEAREYLHQLPTRKDIQDAFIAQGIGPIEARARIDSLASFFLKQEDYTLIYLPFFGYFFRKEKLGGVIFLFGKAQYCYHVTGQNWISNKGANPFTQLHPFVGIYSENLSDFIHLIFWLSLKNKQVSPREQEMILSESLTALNYSSFVGEHFKKHHSGPEMFLKFC